MQLRENAGCLEWTGRQIGDGYGRLFFRRNLYAHRVAFELRNGPIPVGMYVDHRCHNKLCVNADHLRLATPKQNQEHRKGANSNSLTGARGITYDRTRRQYCARIKHNYVEHHIGRFDTLEEAEVAASQYRRKLFTHNDKDRAA
ncbi:HNH endonuclease [Williamsia muralis]